VVKVLTTEWLEFGAAVPNLPHLLSVSDTPPKSEIYRKPAITICLKLLLLIFEAFLTPEPTPTESILSNI